MRNPLAKSITGLKFFGGELPMRDCNSAFSLGDGIELKNVPVQDED
jgi:hypothetical protein